MDDHSKTSDRQDNASPSLSTCSQNVSDSMSHASLMHIASLAHTLSEIFHASPIPAFAIDAHHKVTHWNRACEQLTGISAATIIGTDNHWQPFYKTQRPLLVDLVVDNNVEEAAEKLYWNKVIPSSLIAGAYEIEDFFPFLSLSGRWLFSSASPLRDSEGQLIGALTKFQDVTQRKLAESDLYEAHQKLEKLVAKRTEQLAEVNKQLEEDIQRRKNAEDELLRRNAELTALNHKLSNTQAQLLQSEKLASIGQLAAGVAHEINNPIGYIFSNFSSLEGYIENLLKILTLYEDAEEDIRSSEKREQLFSMRNTIELDYLKNDIPDLMRDSKEGIVRVRKIVQDLKDFSRIDTHQEWQLANIHQGIDSTLNIVSNEVKYKADIIKEYGDIPEVECLLSQINQVVLNLVLNAAHAIGTERGKITIRTGRVENNVWIEIKDTGCGIPKEILPRIFDPFFTTKPVGSGTGLGLSLSYGIIQKHNGHIEVDSESGRGTCFRITLPVNHK